MKVIGLLNFYQESALWLAATVASASKCIDHLIACDGAYFLFPDGAPHSGAEQAAVINEVAQAHNLGCTIHAPQETWAGNEVEKRAFLFTLAETISDPDDWYMVIDADEVVTDAPPNLRERLEAADEDVAEVTFWERDDIEFTPKKAKAARQFDWPAKHEYPIRILFRAIRGLTVERNHYTYTTPDKRVLWGNRSSTVQQEPALDCKDLRIEHRTNFRDLARRNAAKEYYGRRDRVGAESDPCFHCNKTGTRVIQHGWVEVGDALEASSISVCEDCYPIAKAESDRQIRALGRDPEGLAYEGAAG